jgi:hypothetical protein
MSNRRRQLSRCLPRPYSRDVTISRARKPTAKHLMLIQSSEHIRRSKVKPLLARSPISSSTLRHKPLAYPLSAEKDLTRLLFTPARAKALRLVVYLPKYNTENLHSNLAHKIITNMESRSTSYSTRSKHSQTSSRRILQPCLPSTPLIQVDDAQEVRIPRSQVTGVLKNNLVLKTRITPSGSEIDEVMVSTLSIISFEYFKSQMLRDSGFLNAIFDIYPRL